MLVLKILILSLFSISMLMIFLYSLSQLHLLMYYLKSDKKKQPPAVYDLVSENEVPYITVQLPVYNEKYVMNRLLHCIAELDYPLNKLEVQVLDDSTDDSVTETAVVIQELRSKGLDILHIRRANRVNFKAGALKEGLKTAKGEFVAIFDADFLPETDWLKRTVIYFKNPSIGVVQTRWGHINEDYSLLTKAQAFALNSHFTLEQSGRNKGGHFINFNGTAGIWRKQTIIDAGNWEGDTLTEDLDLSYRAQLKGWEFKYLEDVVTPAELPVVVSAARSQQFRWNKGGAENLLKMFRRIIKSSTIPFTTKLHGIFHLANSSMFFFMLILSVLSVPVLYIQHYDKQFSGLLKFHSIFISSTVILFICNWMIYRKLKGGSLLKFAEYTRIFFAFFSVAMGFSLHNTLAVVQAYSGRKTEFIRTPKFNINKVTDSWKGNSYLTKKLSLSLIFETMLLLYFGFGLVSAWMLKDYSQVPFHLMLLAGYGYIIVQSFKNKITG